MTLTFVRTPLLGLLLTAAHQMTVAGAAAAQDAPAQVRTAKPKPGAASEPIRLPVIAEPDKEASLYARVNGFVASRAADIGDAVAEGAVLAVIDAPEIERNRDRAQASVAQAEARVAVADANLKRTATLAGKDFASEATLDDRRSQLNVAIADRDAAVAEVRRLDQLLAFRQVRAPFAGIIVERNVEIGNLVVGDAASDATPMFRIARIDDLRVVVDVPQTALSAVREGEPVAVVFGPFGEEKFQARVARMSKSIERSSGTMRVELALPNPGGRVPAGLAGHAEFQQKTVAAALVPSSAVFTRDGRPHVAVVEAGAVQFRAVTLGRDLGRVVEVIGGLSASDDVVLNPNGMLRAGDPAAATAAAAATKS
ncbi:MAG: efflux RND transporter periplasmic adaptor subunit [Hyphomicrobiales bacterium]|nr:efflux RND transporter periplasmic adaptor subunit [Hyphomicrobiales bacterium]